MPSCHQQGHAGGKILLQQNPPVLNYGCPVTEVGRSSSIFIP